MQNHRLTMSIPVVSSSSILSGSTMTFSPPTKREYKASCCAIMRYRTMVLLILLLVLVAASVYVVLWFAFRDVKLEYEGDSRWRRD